MEDPTLYASSQGVQWQVLVTQQQHQQHVQIYNEPEPSLTLSYTRFAAVSPVVATSFF
jgi:hypothetical protein